MKCLVATFVLLSIVFCVEVIAAPRGVQSCQGQEVWKPCTSGCERQCHGELLCGATLTGCKEKKADGVCVCQKGFSRSADRQTCKPDVDCPLP
ncbi:hypothetical protein QR680_017825 [Steinernema hermaphroditum]|uniref:TIL domain-containing protein n=1 Tax=Steinernema hermaphroditum TaxID=289476 RepID=A0AA39HGM2_9BILA|nr:hypothetical protein QR680_017825 [Steinernema hermaphroditum]